MTKCTATLTTASIADEQVGPDLHSSYFHPDLIPDGLVVKRDGDRLLRVDLHTLTCEVPRDEHYLFSDGVEEHAALHPDDDYHLRWRDNWKGATPHVEQVEVPGRPVKMLADVEPCRGECIISHLRGRGDAVKVDGQWQHVTLRPLPNRVTDEMVEAAVKVWEQPQDDDCSVSEHFRRALAAALAMMKEHHDDPA